MQLRNPALNEQSMGNFLMNDSSCYYQKLLIVDFWKAGQPAIMCLKWCSKGHTEPPMKYL